MLRVINLRGRRAGGERPDYAAIVPRADFDVAAATEIVRPICEDVARRGVAALAEYSVRFDRVLPHTFRVPRTRPLPRGFSLTCGRHSRRRSSAGAASVRPSLATTAARSAWRPAQWYADG